MTKYLKHFFTIAAIVICGSLLVSGVTGFAAASSNETERPDIDHPLYDLNYEEGTITGIYYGQHIEDFLKDFSNAFKVSVWNNGNKIFNGVFEIGMIVEIEFQGQLLGNFNINELPIFYSKPVPMAANSYGFTSMFRGKAPLNYVTSEYGMRNGKLHGGIDISWSGIGGTSIYAVKAGKVIESRFESSWGNTVMIDHGNNQYTRYAHMRDTPSVKVGASVTPQNVLGVVGTTGNSTGNHLHFEVYEKGSGTDKRVNPRPYLVGAGDPVSKNGWVTENGNKYYYVNGSKVTGGQKIGSYWYYFAPSTGIMHTGWRTDGSTKYYYNSSGQLLFGRQKIGSYWYFFNETNGKMHAGWRTEGSDKYYYNTEGQLLFGAQKIGSFWYYFNTNGKMHVGWRTEGSAKYYYNSDGQLLRGAHKVSGSWYYFNTDGKMHTGWRTDGNVKYYYHSDGKLAFGPQTIGGKDYYFNKTNGKMIINDWADGFYYGADGVKVK